MGRQQGTRRAAAEGPAPGGLADAALVPLARAGDEAAIRQLVRRHNQLLFRVARGILRDDAEAEDAVQETYVRAFAALDGFRGDAGLGTWLTRIAINVALGRLRRARPRADLAEAEAAAAAGAQVIMLPTADPEAEAARGQVRRLLERCLDELPEAFRLVVILRDVHGLSTEAAAEHLGIPPATARTRLHRGRRLLRSGIARRLHGGFGDLFPFDGDRCDGLTERVVRLLARPPAGA
jgi:RNA polymerase sigma-70 factor (ECF subfamily)